MRYFSGLLLTGLLIFLLSACGGGGGGFGGGAVLQGRVVLVGTGNPPNPQATVEAGGRSTRTDLQEGTFQLAVPIGTTQLIVRAPGLPQFTFRLPILQADQTVDLGDLYIGPETVSVQGRIINALTQEPVGDAEVILLGQRAFTNPVNGRFTLNDVAYDPEGILDPEGEVRRTGFIPRRFLVDQPVISGVIDLGDIPLLPETDENPPAGPGNVQGIVIVPADTPIGVRIDIYNPPSAQFPQESVIVNQSNGQFRLWLLPGDYRLVFVKGTRSATRNVSVSDLQTPINLGQITLQ